MRPKYFPTEDEINKEILEGVEACADRIRIMSGLGMVADLAIARYMSYLPTDYYAPLAKELEGMARKDCYAASHVGEIFGKEIEKFLTDFDSPLVMSNVKVSHIRLVACRAHKDNWEKGKAMEALEHIDSHQMTLLEARCWLEGKDHEAPERKPRVTVECRKKRCAAGFRTEDGLCRSPSIVCEKGCDKGEEVG